MPRAPRSVRRPPRLAEMKPAESADFRDSESQRILQIAARAVAHELGREAARDYFAELIGKPKIF